MWCHVITHITHSVPGWVFTAVVFFRVNNLTAFGREEEEVSLNTCISLAGIRKLHVNATTMEVNTK